MEPLIMDALKSGQPPYNGQTVHPLPIILSTSEEGTTSEQWTKRSSPTCPILGGSTAHLGKAVVVVRSCWQEGR